MQGSKFNLTIVTTNEYGVYNEDTSAYTGLYGLLQRDEVDFSLVPMPIIGLAPQSGSR